MHGHAHGTAALLFDARAGRWLRFSAPRTVFDAHRLEDVVPVLEAVEREVMNGRRWAVGFVTYEASPAFDSALQTKEPGRLPLAWFSIHEAPESFAPADLPEPQSGPIPAWKPTVDRDAYGRAIRRIKRYIEAGDTYQVNYTLRLRSRFRGDPEALFRQLMAAQSSARYGACIETPEWALCSASPEMFFEWDGRELLSRPMKGTAPRGPSTEADRILADELYHSEKNRAENVMIVDMVRNDMGRIADVGSVEVPSLFAVERYPTLFQMTSTVRCTTGAGIPEIFGALFPAASITGAPKARTMEIIAELETTPRNVYTGTMGFISPEPRAQFNVTIRTVLVDRMAHLAEYGVGGGIVWDSTTEGEFEECLTKARILTRRRPDFDLLESLLWTPEEGYPLMEAHLARLTRSAGYFDRPFDGDAVQKALIETARNVPPAPHKVRLLVRVNGRPQVAAQPLQPLPSPWRMGLADAPVDPSDPFLHHKTTHRDVYDAARAAHPEWNDVLLWNTRGELTESTIANVLFELDGEWVTPPASCGLLAGVGRALLLEKAEVRERVVRLDELDRVTRIHLVNSVRGRWEARFETSAEASDAPVRARAGA